MHYSLELVLYGKRNQQGGEEGSPHVFVEPSIIVFSTLALLTEPRRLDASLSDVHFIEPPGTRVRLSFVSVAQVPREEKDECASNEVVGWHRALSELHRLLPHRARSKIAASKTNKKQLRAPTNVED